jgi:DUF1680 family protein
MRASNQFLLMAGLISASAAGACYYMSNAQAALESSGDSYTKVWAGQVITDAEPFAAHPLPLADVRLTGGPLKHAQDLDIAYLLSLEPDKMLASLRERAGIPSKVQNYGGWDGEGRQLTGHIAGHYLSAVSLMYAATGDTRFKERADYLVKSLKEIQDKQGDGYIGALMATAPGSRPAPGQQPALVDGKQRFEDLGKGIIQSGGFDLNGMWSPWYVEHKIFAGLRDAYRYTGNKDALAVEIKLAGWVDGILSKLSEDQIQQMLKTEFGGMNEVMADLYADTGDQRWLKACAYFEHHAIIDPLAHQQDILAGKHGNTQVPKVIGEAMRYVYTGNKDAGAAAGYFWDAVVYHHTFATGGHGHDEYFGPADQLSNVVDGRTDESCNVYNMLKLSRTLFALHPDVKYADFEERALFNHVLGSIDPDDGATCYMVPVGRGVTREYQDMFGSFTCCVGTGMENHALHGYGIYYESGNKLWVNLYTPSTAKWESAGATIETQTTFPEGDYVSIHVSLSAPKDLTLALRRPSWAGDGFDVKINGTPVSNVPAAGSYVELSRTWENGDVVSMTLPKALHTEALPDNPNRRAILWGPLVLAGDMGPEGDRQMRHADAAPIFVTDNQPLTDWLKPVPNQPGFFHSSGTGKPTDVSFEPFYELHRRVYAAYWDFYNQQEWQKKATEIAAENERQQQLKAATVAFAQPGEMQPERDFNEQGEGSEPVRVMGRAGRKSDQWFSFDLPVEAGHPMAVVVTYYTDEWRKRTFDILADGQQIGQQTVEKGGEPRFFDVKYSVPAQVVEGRAKLTVKFQATDGNETAAVYGIRMIRDEPAAK